MYKIQFQLDKCQIKVDYFVWMFQVDRFSLVYYAPHVDEEGLSEVTLGLHAHTEVALFPGGGPLELRCTAAVQERNWAATASAHLARLSNQKLAQDHEPNHATGTITINSNTSHTCSSNFNQPRTVF